MSRRTTPRVYREVVLGPAKDEQNQLPPGWSPLDDYRAARATSVAPSPGSELSISAIRSWCPCRECVARRNAA